MNDMKVALLQQNFVVGDIAGNSKKILSAYRAACDKGAELVVSSELALLGYPPRDLLERSDLILSQVHAVEDLARKVGPSPLIVGFAEPNKESRGKVLFNAAAVLHKGKLSTIRRKALLPTYDVFDEYRYFEPYTKSQEPIEIAGKKFGVLVCEDIWNGIEDPDGRKQYHFDPVAGLKNKGIQALLVLNGSPYFWGKGDVRLKLAAEIGKTLSCPVLYSNQTGANDELIFDGRSFAVDARGNCIGAAPPWSEDMLIVETDSILGQSYPHDTDNLFDVEQALVSGVHDYVAKVGSFSGGAVIGLSGGIDSSIVACIAQKALGNEKVRGIAMPSPYSSKESLEDAQALAKSLGIQFYVIPIKKPFTSFQDALSPVIGWDAPPKSTVEENIQARIRGIILMAIANREHRIVLGTGNKSELAMGYATLYGDMAAGLGVISDLPKTLVYKLAAHMNREKEIIPKRILEKPPSAELRPGQKDSDSLPVYEALDPILHAYIEERKGPQELITAGFDPVLVRRVVQGVDSMEFKRRQAAPGLKITAKAFGTGRRMPIAARTTLNDK